MCAIVILIIFFVVYAFVVLHVISFYPQVWLNYKRKSVTGLSLEYQAYNITGSAM